VAVLISSAFSVFKKREDPEAFHRRLSADVVRSASAVLSMYVALFMLGSIVICQLEDVPIMPAMFETASAIGTVGLSLGITPGLCTVSKVVLISLMYFGRVGGLTLIFAAASGIQKKRSKYPLEKVAVG
jgi:trk system potassium uptake protein TrkH